MNGPLNRKARPDVAASGADNIPRQRADLIRSREHDQRLLSLDFIAERGDSLVTLGAAISAAAAAENVVVLELVLRQARAVVVETIGEFRTLSGNPPVSESLRASPAFQAVAREYSQGRAE